ncbi:MAG: hypothetical protein ABI658_23595 [Acidimicrobiales bacterium]
MLRRALGATAWFVLEELVVRATVIDGELRVRAPTREIADALGLNKDTVTQALVRLRANKTITSVRRGGSGGATAFAVHIPSRLITIPLLADEAAEVGHVERLLTLRTNSLGSSSRSQRVHLWWVRPAPGDLCETVDVASHALDRWRVVGLARLAELEGVHAQATGGGRGRRWGTEQLNRSLLVALVAQFQSFCRDLHDEAVAVHVAAARPGQAAVLRTLLTQGRKLDAQNPRRSTLGSDFGRLGFSFIDDLEGRGAATESRLEQLDVLVDFRNAIGHGDEASIAAIEAQGRIKSTKKAYQQYRSALK